MIDEDIKHVIFPIEWTTDGLKEMRNMLGLSQKTVASFLNTTPGTICNLEKGNVTDPMKIFAYGTLLERYYALEHGYVVSYRKIGSSNCIAKF